MSREGVINIGIKSFLIEQSRLARSNSDNQGVRGNEQVSHHASWEGGVCQRPRLFELLSSSFGLEPRITGSSVLGLTEVPSWLTRPQDDGWCYYVGTVSARLAARRGRNEETG